MKTFKINGREYVGEAELRERLKLDAEHRVPPMRAGPQKAQVAR